MTETRTLRNFVGGEYVDPAEGRTYDLVFANILARPLCRMARSVAGGLMPAGTVILSGLLASQARMVMVAHRRQGLQLESKLQEGTWTTLVMRKAGRAS